MNKPYYQDDYATIYHGDCREILPTLDKVDLVLTDPPYGKVRGDFDHEWTNRPAMLASCREWIEAMFPVIKPNGTLYWFAYPSLAGRIESMIAEFMHPLAHVVWKSGGCTAMRASPEALRAPISETERLLMFEHYGADNMALGESGYQAKCDELRGFVFEPLRAYLAGERDRAGLTTRNVAEQFQKKTGSKTVTGMAGHWFESVQWTLPTAANYEWLRGVFNGNGGDYLRREYEDLRREYEDLRREYEDLRREYEDLRRYFDLQTGDPKTDVWEFSPCAEKLGHPTPKPIDLMRYIVRLSCRPNGVVLDPFAGGGTTLRAAKDLRRKSIGIERNEKYCEIAAKRLQQEVLAL